VSLTPYPQAIVVTHFLTLFRLGWGWIFILMGFCATYYSTSIERVRRRSRDDILRSLTKTRLANESETADWMNTFLERFWLIYEPVLSRTIVASVDQILSVSTPAFLDSLRLSTFSLGTKAPHIDEVRTHTDTAEDVVLMEWGVSFTPNDVSDITPRQAKKKINPKIVLEIRVGKGLTAAMPVLLEDITFQGKMKIRMKLMTAFPHIQTVDLSFVEKPHIDYVLKPIGGETFGFDIASVSARLHCSKT
jgi:Ca2+-dependent lipid-binding protein